MEKLVKQPFLHDKVEFNIVYSCYTLDIDDRLTKLPKDLFSTKEIERIKSSLLALTNRILNPQDGLNVDVSPRIISRRKVNSSLSASDEILEIEFGCFVDQRKIIEELKAVLL